nr:hypothetical protein [Tanacetum cinerariifolium]
GIITNIDVDEDVTLKDVAAVAKDVAAVEKDAEIKENAYVQGRQDEAYARELEAELNKNIDWDEVIEQVQRKEKEDNAATPLARKVPIVDYEIYTENNKPYYKIIRADGSPQLFLSFLSLLRNFDREDLEVLWQLVEERFASSKPKNFSDDFLLTTLTYLFEKPDVQAKVWKNQKSVHGLAKVKSWRLLEPCGVHIITFTTTQMILLVERRYPLKSFTLDQMLNNVRLEVEEESEVSLELLRFTENIKTGKVNLKTTHTPTSTTTSTSLYAELVIYSPNFACCGGLVESGLQERYGLTEMEEGVAGKGVQVLGEKW